MTNLLRDKFEEIKDSEDVEQINEFLISIGKSPEKEYVSFIKYFLKALDPKSLDKIKINLAYFLGELGKKEGLDEDLVLTLVNMYYSSDRWVRNEIIQALGKLYMIDNPPPKVAKVFTRALMEEYHPILLSSLNILSRLADIPDLAFKNILTTFDTQDSEIRDYYSKIVFNHLHTEEDLFNIINKLEIASSMNIKTVRNLIMIYFDTVIPLQSFRGLIENSEWDTESKERFVKEIDNFSKALLSF